MAPQWIEWRREDGGWRFYPMRLQVKRETLMLHMGLWSRGREVSERNLEAAESSGSTAEIAACRYNLAGFLSRFGDRRGAMELYRLAREEFRRLGDGLKEALAERNMGNIHKQEGRGDQAVECYRRSLDYFRRNGRDLEMSETLSNLANVHADRKEFRQAWSLYREAIELARSRSHLRSLANALYNAASIQVEQRDLAGAMASYGEALEIHRRIGDLSRIAYDLGSIGEIQMLSGRLNEALDHFKEVERISLEVNDQYSVAYAHEYIGRTLHGLGRFEEALGRFQLQLGLSEAIQDKEREARANGWLGIASAALGRTGAAADHLARAIADSETLGLDFLACEWHYHLAWLPPAAAGDVRGHNRRAAELAARLKRRDMAFLCRVQAAVIDFLEAGEEESREGAVDALRAMMEEKNDKPGKARLYYECWRLLAEMGRDDDSRVMGRKAARLYQDLAEETEAAEWRARLEELGRAGVIKPE